MARGMLNGNISFGLVTIPVSVVSGENKGEELDFDLLDRRDNAHIGYQKINKNTGKVVASENIVKGLKLESGKYAIFEAEELKDLRIKGTNSIDIQEFVMRDEVDPVYFRKFYYLTPGKGGSKTYVLLRETLKKVGKYAIGVIVMHNKQQLVLIGASSRALILHTLLYSSEIKSEETLDVPAAGLKGAKVSDKEIAMAERLVEELTGEWKPVQFKDTFVRDVRAALKSKSRRKVNSVDEAQSSERDSDEAVSKVLDLMPLLEKSLQRKKKKSSAGSRRAAS